MALPSPSAFLTALISSLQTTEHAATQSDRTIDNLKPQLLTLHVLYPNELLPSLDLLDRRQVTRLRGEASLSSSGHVGRGGGETTALPKHLAAKATASEQDRTIQSQLLESGRPRAAGRVYYVHSSRRTAPRSRYHGSAAAADEPATATHEVRLTPWSCSCPAFVFAAYTSADQNGENGGRGGGDAADDDEGHKSYDQAVDGTQAPWCAGGLLVRGSQVPMCKHLLACVLVEHGGGAWEAYVQEEEVGIEEMAAWAAGWGD